MNNYPYDDAILELRALLKPAAKMTVTVINHETHQHDVLMDTSEVGYNKIFVIYDPGHKADMSQHAGSEQSFYYCYSLTELKELVKYLFEHSQTWITEISQDDMLIDNYNDYESLDEYDY
jgi:hypothetical protein